MVTLLLIGSKTRTEVEIDLNSSVALIVISKFGIHEVLNEQTLCRIEQIFRLLSSSSVFPSCDYCLDSQDRKGFRKSSQVAIHEEMNMFLLPKLSM